MAEVVIPEVKHEYIRQVDTTETKDTWFDECIADNKEAAWAGIGTSENDSQYQPAPNVEPDYYMQYCSSDDYDYLKDYRLIWGYGIGIIEQNVICSLSTGEHLAEGKDACDTYATENAAGENVDWKRGIWLKFSGNRNVSPTRIGEVILPERIISLKDLCAALTLENPCDFYLPQENSILNAQNLCGTKTNSPITLCLSEEAGMPFANALNLSYAFAYTDARIWQFDTYAIDESYMFYHAKVGQLVIASMDSSCNYTSKFEEATGDGTTMITASCLDKAMFKNSTKFIIDTTVTSRCKQDVSECFYSCDIYYNIDGIDFSEARNVQRMFYNINIVDTNEIDLDLSSFVEHEDDIEDKFNEFFKTNETNKTINIIAPSCKLKGCNVFSSNTCIYNITNEMIYYDVWDNIDYRTAENINRNLFYIMDCAINGTLIGIHLIGIYNGIDMRHSNLIIKTSEKPTNFNIKNLFKNNYTPGIFSLNIPINLNLNIDDFLFVNLIFTNYNYSISRNNKILTINKEDKEFYIVNENHSTVFDLNINYNENTNCTILNAGKANVENEDDCSIITFINEDNLPIILNVLQLYKEQYYKYYNIKIDAPYGIIKFENSSVSNEKSMVLYFLNIDTIDITYLKPNYNVNRNRYFITAENINTIIQNNTNFIDVLQRGDNQHDIFPYIKTDSDNINIVTDKTAIGLISLIPLTKDYLNFPSYDFNTVTRHQIVGIFNNTKLSDAIKRQDNNNEFILFTLTDSDKIEQCIDDIETEEITLPNYSISLNYNGNINHTLNINTDSINFSINDGYYIYGTYNDIQTRIKKLIINRVINYLYIRKLYDDNEIILPMLNNLNLNECKNVISIIFRTTNKSNIIIVSDNNLPLLTYIEFDNIVIQNELNLQLSDKLTEECINNIINPEKYSSGATLTINTIPFQYITEEQKQALTDAGVTLVEYIPTETTE